ncbi:endonuclease domain-containing protein [Aestuariimicrobium sp. Y1814]|uniref:endonuclease domain-containing protein n=1 Tax=Aestuariimicrobium sp. Y1814 TaxID=3418742 RepID=UPI003DA77D1B
MRILTPTTAALAGITRGQLHGPKFRRLFHGVYVDADLAPTLPVLVAAALVAVPGATVTGVTALRVRGATLGSDSPVWLATSRRVSRTGIVTVPVDRRSSDGIATVTDALEDAQLRLTDEVVTIDQLRRTNRLGPDDHAALAARRPLGWQLSVPDSGSVRESRTRMMVHTAGLPAPQVQFRVLDPVGRFIGRVDFAWPQYRVVLEYEGQQHLTNADQWESDIRRYEQLERLGWTVIRVTAAALRDPTSLVLRVGAALRAGGWRGRVSNLGAAWLAEVA